MSNQLVKLSFLKFTTQDNSLSFSGYFNYFNDKNNTLVHLFAFLKKISNEIFCIYSHNKGYSIIIFISFSKTEIMEITKPKNIHIGKKYIVELAEIAAGIKLSKKVKKIHCNT